MSERESCSIPTPSMLYEYAKTVLGNEIRHVSSREKPWSTVIEVVDDMRGETLWVKSVAPPIPKDYLMIPDVEGDPHLPVYRHVDERHERWIVEDCGELLTEDSNPMPVLQDLCTVLPSLQKRDPVGLQSDSVLVRWDMAQLEKHLYRSTTLTPAGKTLFMEVVEPLRDCGVRLVNTDVHPGNITVRGVLFDWSDAFLTYPTAGLHWFIINCRGFVGEEATVDLLRLYAEQEGDPTAVLNLVVPGSAVAVLLREYIFSELVKVGLDATTQLEKTRTELHRLCDTSPRTGAPSHIDVVKRVVDLALLGG